MYQRKARGTRPLPGYGAILQPEIAHIAKTAMYAPPAAKTAMYAPPTAMYAPPALPWLSAFKRLGFHFQAISSDNSSGL